MNRQRRIVIHDLLLSKCNTRNKIWQKTIFVLKLNIFKPLAISLLEKMLSLKSYMKHVDNINFRQVQSSDPMSWVHWQYCTLSSQPSRLETSEEVASSLDVKINNFVRDISLICFLLTKSWHDVVFIFLSEASAGGFKSAKKQTTQRYMNFRLILTSTPCSRSRSRHCSPLSSNMYFVHWTSLWI